MEIEGMQSYGKDILAERKEKMQAQEPAGKWALVLLTAFGAVFLFALFVQPLHG